LTGLHAAVLGTAVVLGCRAAAPPPVAVAAWSLSPQPPTMGPGTLTFTMAEAGARLRVEGHMAHPGMAPVLAEARDLGRGRYQADLTFTMAGDWFLIVSGALPDGRRVEHRIDIAGVRPRS
jgi:hypothetical protein